MYGITNTSLTWFRNYLNSRQQCVKLNGRVSSCLDIVMGIPQGSILGPTLFLLFVNDLPNCITSCQCNLFADDSVLYAQGSSPTETQSILQADLENLINWFDMNKLHVNASKSSCMTFSTRRNIPEIDVTINGIPLQNDIKTKYLGVNISNDMSWNTHISHVCRKLGHGIQVLRRLKTFISIDDLVNVYKTVLQPHIDYCLTIWGFAPQYQIKRVQVLQNKIFRMIVGDYSWETSPRDILRYFNIPNVIQRRDYFNGLQVFKCLHDLSPNYMSDMLHSTKDFNMYSTRNSTTNMLYVPRPRVEIFKESFQYNGPLNYNTIPNDVKESQTLTMFKSQLKCHIMSSSSHSK